MNKKTKICINAMVGNEEKTISRMLESVAPYTDYWVIQCNGTDNTKNIIEKFFSEKNIPGFTYHIDWNFPGWNRDHTLQKCLAAEHNCDWILRMDADERLHVDPDFDWSILDDTSVQSYNITAQAGDTKYFRTWFWNSKLPWYFSHDKRHETIHLPELDEQFQRINMPYGFRHLVSQDGDTWFAPRKFLRDALELEIDKIVGNTVLDDSYHLWYIAKSYTDCYGNPDELPFGRKHSEEYARRSIWYYERFFEHIRAFNLDNTARIQDEMCYFGLIMMAHCYQFLGNQEKTLECFKLSHQFSPTRNESYLYQAFHLESLGKFNDCIEVLDIMLKPERKNVFPNYSFLIEDRAYYDTSSFLTEFREKLVKKTTEHTIDSESLSFKID